MRLGLALRCFWRVLRGRPLPEGVQAPALPAPQPQTTGSGTEQGAVTLLRLLQREGRFVDFVREQLEGFDDARVGAAARAVHAGCRRVLERYVALEPVIDAEEGEPVTIEPGFDAAAIELTGNLSGRPPLRGVLRHHGWRVRQIELPAVAPGAERVVAPAEVEIP